MKPILLLLTIILFSPCRLSAQDSVLDELDETISSKSSLSRLETIDSLRSLYLSASLPERVRLCRDIQLQYSMFQSDSALHYANVLIELARQNDDKSMRDYAYIRRAVTLGVMGAYNEANNQLDVLRAYISPEDKQTLIDYMHARRTIFGWMASYLKGIDVSSNPYSSYTDAYRDSIIRLDDDFVSRSICVADDYICKDNPTKAKEVLKRVMDKAEGDQLAYALYNMAVIEKMLGQRDSMIYYLAKTSIYDIKRGVTEYTALQELASELYSLGDVERSYNYLICALEDASFCNARLRSISIARIYPIIYNAHQASLSQRRLAITIGFILAALFIVSMAVFAFYFYKELIKLRIARQQLAESNSLLESLNQQLEKANSSLRESDKIKEKYFTYYLERCRKYLDILNQRRKDFLKLSMSGQHSELLKQLKSTSLVDEEKKLFYDDFDKAFLKIYPDFVRNFNALLLPENQIVPKDKERLTTELRIFALNRLGIDDAAQIAHFLDYSMPTIYIYRSRIRSYSSLDKDEFQRRLMET